MTYTETVAWLFDQLPNYQLQGSSAYKPGLDNIKKLLQKTGNPEKDLRFFHVAGTNGKGSVSNMLASVLQENGYKTGLFTSPHLHDFRERIRINGEMISESFVIDFVEQHKESWDEIRPSFFEITTAMALAAFKATGCEICVIETGLGGRLDSTNVILPEVSVITNIGIDHTIFLGNTPAEIAMEKGGIIKENVPVVIGEWTEKTKPVFEKIATEKNAPLYVAEKHTDYSTDLSGTYQAKNVSTVIAALNQFQKKGWKLDDAKTRTGLLHVSKNTGFKARFQKLQNHPSIIVDAAHNEDGVKILFNEIAQMQFENLHLIYGAANDKDLKSIFSQFPSTANYYFTEFDSKRSVKLDLFKELASEFKLNSNFFLQSRLALKTAKESAKKNDLIVIFGSFYLVQEII